MTAGRHVSALELPQYDRERESFGLAREEHSSSETALLSGPVAGTVQRATSASTRLS